MKMSENGIRPQFVATLFFMLLGISALLFGVIYLLFAPKRLDPRVVEYNRVVDSWTSTNRKEFESFTFNLTLLDVQNSPNFPYRPQNQQQFQLSPDTTPDKLYKDYFYWLHKYHPLKYTLDPGTLLGSDPMVINFTQTVDMTMIYRYDGPETKKLVHEADQTVMSYPLFLKLPYRNPSCDYGFIDHGACYLVYKLQSLCVKVKKTGPGSLALDREYGGIGCGPTDKNIRTLFSHDWVAANYMFMNVENTSAIYNYTALFDDLAVHIRSTQDPLVYAELITNGTLNFNGFEGPGSGLYITTTRGFIGFGSIGVGAFIILPAVCCLLLFACIRPKPRLQEEKGLLNNSKRVVEDKQRSNWEAMLFPKSSFVPRSPDQA